MQYWFGPGARLLFEYAVKINTCERCQIVSWNVDGLRAKLRLDGLTKIVNAEQPDLLVIQETKIQVLLALGSWKHITWRTDVCFCCYCFLIARMPLSYYLRGTHMTMHMVFEI